MDETIVRMIDTNGQNERTVWAQVVEEERISEVTRVPVVGSDGPPSTPIRRISIVSDDATRLQRSPSPPRHPPSNVLFLSNLVRPFTVQQLKELLARTGTVAEDGFWIDRIKSMCLVQYETEEQARETRHALHGVRWPISNPKRLFVDFSTKERLEEAKREGNMPTPVPPAVATPSLSPPHTAPRDDFPRKTEPLRVDGSGMVPVHHPVHRVREWDLDKVVQQSPPGAGMHGPNRGPVEERRRPEAAGQPSGRRDRMLPSPPPSMQEIQARKAKRKEAEAAAAAAAEAPANLLDSLFRKTKATPSIYWLPLTAEQIKVKEEIRRQHLAEHERRIAEMKRAAEKDRGSRRRRRSSTPRRRSRRRSGEGSSAAHKKSSESMKGHKTSSASPKK
ncbi:hypothetical protein J437_LFUL014815 [Ladona fulva]|uniref:RRM domain-containing protein n=1 Tax=Ladona fulva TaxID=123851 RepID=A0A8K0KQU5_LADFU|nr:hypothetical protein J437_LFUL014815 [Ladona fulva]